MKMIPRYVVTFRIALVVVAATACQTHSDQTATADSAKRAGGMSGIQGMAGMMPSGMMDSMMTSMRSDIVHLRTMSGAQMKGALPAHRQMAANMLSQMNADMRRMNMPADPAWNALVDSVRQDLVRLPDVPAGELPATFPSHLARVERLMAMHQAMMKR